MLRAEQLHVPLAVRGLLDLLLLLAKLGMHWVERLTKKPVWVKS
jgi:hypothetical protein